MIFLLENTNYIKVFFRLCTNFRFSFTNFCLELLNSLFLLSFLKENKDKGQRIKEKGERRKGKGERTRRKGRDSLNKLHLLFSIKEKRKKLEKKKKKKKEKNLWLFIDKKKTLKESWNQFHRKTKSKDYFFHWNLESFFFLFFFSLVFRKLENTYDVINFIKNFVKLFLEIWKLSDFSKIVKEYLDSKKEKSLLEKKEIFEKSFFRTLKDIFELDLIIEKKKKKKRILWEKKITGKKKEIKEKNSNKSKIKTFKK